MGGDADAILASRFMFFTLWASRYGTAGHWEIP
jgi:hypothetical protein